MCQGGSVFVWIYLDDELHVEVRRFKNAVGPKFLLTDESTQPQQAYLMSGYL